MPVDGEFSLCQPLASWTRGIGSYDRQRPLTNFNAGNNASINLASPLDCLP